MKLHQLYPFCSRCGAKVSWTVPAGDNRHRRVCRSCDTVHYANPKVVVGSVVFSGDKVLMCRRAIDPQKGLWTLPAGFMERGETPEEGAQREAEEEACATLSMRGLLAVYSLTHINQVQLMFLADLASDVAAGPESEEVALYTRDEIPWDRLAFATVRWALEYAFEVRKGETWAVQRRDKDDSTPMTG